MPTPRLAEFSYDHYTYIEGQRMRVGLTRTLRPTAGEPSADFRTRITRLVQHLVAAEGIMSIEMDEELRDGQLWQCVIRLRLAPTPAPLP